MCNQRFLEERVDIANGMRACKNLERFLIRLSVIDKNTEIIALDWGDHEEWQYKTYRDRVKKNESERAQARSNTISAGNQECRTDAQHQLADSTRREIKEESDN